MSFSFENFFLDRGNFNSNSRQQTFAIHRYFSTDTQSDLTALNYFPAFFGCEPGMIQFNDHLYVQFSDGDCIDFLVFLDEFGHIRLQPVASGSDSESIKIETGVNGVQTSFQINTFFTLTKQNSLVVMHVPYVDFSVNQVESVLTFSEKIPERFLPFDTFNFVYPIVINNSNLYSYGLLNIRPSGTIAIGVFSTSSPFPGVFSVGSIGWQSANVVWSRIVS